MYVNDENKNTYVIPSYENCFFLKKLKLIYMYRFACVDTNCKSVGQCELNS